MYTGKIKAPTNIRNSPPGGTYQDIGDLLVGDEVTADEIRMVNNYPWWHLTGWTRNGQAIALPGFVCWAYGVNIDEIVTTPAPGAPSVFVGELADGSTLMVKDKDGNILWQWPEV